MIETFDLALPHGITLACRAGGSGDQRVLLLHGFPEAAFVWDAVIERLAPHARCVAPNLRGYPGSSAPTAVADYRPKLLGADVMALIEHIGAPVDVLVAHDWGGAIAWNVAAARPDLMKHLVIVNSPHPGAFLRELQGNPAQQAASAYMTFLCRPDAEELLTKDDFAALWPFVADMHGGAGPDEALKARYREVWRRLSGPLNYYRASPLRPPRPGDDAVLQLRLAPEAVTVRVPTTVLWAEADRALLPALVDGLEAFVPQLELVRVPGASHWIVHEQPQLVAETIARVISAPGAQSTT
jgi:pimeloyl-ACP methyl ester carboxylesterase